MNAQMALCGNDCATTGNRVASFSISSMIIPRKASRETSRPDPSALAAGPWTTAASRGLWTCTLPIEVYPAVKLDSQHSLLRGLEFTACLGLLCDFSGCKL